MRIADRLAAAEPCFSFEFFPPKTDLGRAHLFEALDDLEELAPGFISITCGASGSARAPSLDLVAELKARRRFEVMAHLTCHGQSRAALLSELERLRGCGIENVFALRGDPPPEGAPEAGDGDGEASGAGSGGGDCGDGPRTAADFARLIGREGFGFCLGGAAYPEIHPRAASREADLAALEAKVAAGARFLITQLFFDNAFYFDFVARARAAGVEVPIVPGIMPITSFEQIERFTRQCAATLPMRLRLEMEKHQRDPEAVRQLGIAHATLQCMDLMNRGVRHLHFFTLNKSKATRLIVTALKTFRP